MKKLITLCLLLALSTIVAGNLNNGRKKNSTDSAKCLMISGKIESIENGEMLNAANSYKVELIYYNTVVKTVIKKDTKSFKFLLKKNSIYTIRISKQGYIDKLISINTSLDENNSGMYRFYCSLELVKETLKKNLDEEALEFPIAIVSYDYDADCFYFNEEYTANIKKNIFEK